MTGGRPQGVTLTWQEAIGFAMLLVAIIGGIVRNESRFTRIETLLDERRANEVAQSQHVIDLANELKSQNELRFQAIERAIQQDAKRK